MTCRFSSAFFADACLFPLSQFALLAFLIFVILMDVVRRVRTRKGFDGLVTRGDKSMAVFYGAYGVFTTVLVAVVVSVDYAENHRTLFVFFDVAAVAYACLWNAWFRDKLIAWTNALPKREHR